MTFSWEIFQLYSIPTFDVMDKVISLIQYKAIKKQDNFTAILEGSLFVGTPHEASFTPYAEVTKAMVEGWLTEGLDTEAIEANLDAQIENFLNPPIVAYPLPWAE